MEEIRVFVLQLIVILAVLAGTAFSIIGVLGLIRLPDVYTRLQATAKVGVFGVALLVIAAIFWTPLSFGRGLVLIVVLVVVGPATSHAIGSAAYRFGIPMRQAIRDDLARDVHRLMAEDEQEDGQRVV